MKYVLFYEAADDVAEKAPLHGAEHRAHWDRYLAAGTLLMIGPFANPKDGALAIFKTKEAAEEFAQTDPFVKHGVVVRWRVAEWMEAIVK